MKRFLLDTGIASDYLNKRQGVFEEARRRVANGSIIGIGVPILAELVYGIEKSRSRDANFLSLKSALPTLKLWPFDKASAYEYGRLASELYRLGRPMQVIDMMIASIAITLRNCTVVSKDSDLAAVPGLSVENWTR